MSSLVLATLLSGLILVADRLVDVWTPGHLAVAVLVLWLVLFAGLALLSEAVRRWAYRIAAGSQSGRAPPAPESHGGALLPDAGAGLEDAASPRRTDAAARGLTPRAGRGVPYRPW